MASAIAANVWEVLTKVRGPLHVQEAMLAVLRHHLLQHGKVGCPQWHDLSCLLTAQVGDIVEAGQKLMVLEAMKV